LILMGFLEARGELMRVLKNTPKNFLTNEEPLADFGTVFSKAV